VHPLLEDGDRRRVRVGPGQLPGEELVEQDAEREDVGAGVDLAAETVRPLSSWLGREVAKLGSGRRSGRWESSGFGHGLDHGPMLSEGRRERLPSRGVGGATVARLQLVSYVWVLHFV
jgi:hypothetical protein